MTVRRKYLDFGPVVGVMASSAGLRWQLHLYSRVARRDAVQGAPSGEKESTGFSRGENVNS